MRISAGTLVVLLASWIVASHAYGADDKKGKAKKEQASDEDEEGEDDEEDDRPVTVDVPSNLRGKGYSLRYEDEQVPLDADKVSLRRTMSRDRVEIVDSRGRVITDDKVYVDERIFYHLSDRNWKIGLMLGGVSANGDAYKDLLLSGHFGEFSLEAAYQPGPLGVHLSLASISGEGETQGVTSSYTASQTRLAASYELAPFSHNAGMRRWHLVALAGLHSTLHRIELDDGVVALEDEDAAWGPFAALDFVYPINGFWLGVRGYLTYQEIEFETLDFETKSVQRGFLVGGTYAF